VFAALQYIYILHPCIRCGEPKGMEPAAGAFMGTRDRWPLQDGIKDSSLLHPVIVANCLDTICNNHWVE